MNNEQELDYDKFPHLNFQKLAYKTLEELIGRLQKRKTFLEEEQVSDDEFEENEKHIKIIETTMQLERLQTSLFKKKVYIEDYEKSVKTVLQEMENKFNEVMAKGRLLLDTTPELKEVYANKKDNLYGQNYELKIRDYLTVKNILNPPKDEKKGGLKKA